VKTDSVYDWRHGGRASDHEEEICDTTMNGHHSSSVDFGLFREEEPRPGGGSLVLVIENERELAEEIRLDLDSGGHAVQVAETLTEGLRAARSDDVGVLVIDRLLDGENGLSIIEALRGEGKWTPALVLGGLTSFDERIAGLKAACYYLAKPFDVHELTARVEVLLRLGGDIGVVRLRVGDLEMDLIDRTVRHEGKLVDLVPREFKLLEYFMRRPGQAVTRAMLLEDVWNLQPPAYTNVVDVQIGNLRRKLDPTGNRRVIVSVRSVGFKLNADHSELSTRPQQTLRAL
jgi:two-component system OmpR family response regulator